MAAKPRKPRLPDPAAIRAATRDALFVYAPRYFCDGVNVVNNQSNWHVFEGADPFTFEVLPKLDGNGRGRGLDRYARDRAQVFYGTRRVEGAEAATFELVGKRGYARDAHRHYFLGAPVAARAGDERVHDLLLIADGAVYLSGKPCPVAIDAPSFTLLDDEIGLFWDCMAAYLLHQPYCYASHSHSTIHPIAGADPAAIRRLGGLFVADARSVFAGHPVYRSEGTRPVARLEGLDPATTRVEREYAIGEHAAYFEDQRLERLDLTTLSTGLPLYYACDASGVYYAGRRLLDVEAASFAAFPQSGYARDRAGLMFCGARFAGDVGSFEVLDWDLARDTSTLYQRGSSVRAATRADVVREAHRRRLAQPT